VNFDFSDEQYAVRDLAREVFEREWPPSRLRERWNEPSERDGRLWKSLAQVGLLGLTIPAEHGGTGGDELDLVLVLEEAGRAAVADPLAETLAVAVPLLAEAGSEDQRSTWLPRIASGDAVVAVQLDGSPFVPNADVADLLVVQRGDELYAVSAEGMRLRPVAAEDRARRLFVVDAEVSPETRVTNQATAVETAISRGAAATASFLNGISLRLLEMTLEHVKARHQFGRPIGSFQAVKHKLATMHVALESARAATWYAAYALAKARPDAPVAAHVAKATASETSALVNGEALQLHGGIGFTWEHDLHLWLKRGKALEAAYGSAADHRRALAAYVFAGRDDDDA
jgi:alkylation response protein AidB-like acyl-CoA dehydrogenase